jgi:hypothetical protein
MAHGTRSRYLIPESAGLDLHACHGDDAAHSILSKGWVSNPRSLFLPSSFYTQKQPAKRLDSFFNVIFPPIFLPERAGLDLHAHHGEDAAHII